MTIGSAHRGIQTTGTSQGRIPPLLRMAALGGIEPTIRRHLTNGGAPDLVDQDGRSILWLATSRGHHQICELLIEAGADLFAVDNKNQSIETAALGSGSGSTIQVIRIAIQQRQVEPDNLNRIEEDPTGQGGPGAESRSGTSERVEMIQEDSVLVPLKFSESLNPKPESFSGSLQAEPETDTAEEDSFDLLMGAGFHLGWSPEVDAQPPVSDGSCLNAAASIHDRISRFQATDTDTEWTDIEILLPEIRRGRVSYQGIEEEFLRCAVGVIQEGLQIGSVPSSWISLTVGVAPARMAEDEVRLKFHMLLAELGIQIEDWALDPRSVATPDGEPEDVGEEILSYLSSLVHCEQDELSTYYISLGSLPLLTPEEEQHFGRMWTESEDQGGIDGLVLGNLRYVIREARKFPRNGMGIGDLVSEGNLGLIEGAKRFDPNRENRFLTYASWWVRQSIFRALAEFGNGIRVPQKVAGTLLQLRRLTARLERDLGRTPTEEDVLRSGAYTHSELHHLNRLEHSITLLDLDECDGSPETFSMGMQHQSTLQTPLELHALEEEDDVLAKALNYLSDKERVIISRHFGLDGAAEETLEEIGQSFDPPISRERVRQLEFRAFSRMAGRFPHLRDQLTTFQRPSLVPTPKLPLQEDDDESE